MQTHTSFLEDIIDESVEMQTMHPALFDDYMAEGWRLLGYAIIRHNFAACRGKICRTIPLRIRLKDLSFTKSQKQVLRRNADLKHLVRPIILTPEKEGLFLRHTARFRERRPETLAAFLGPNASRHPVKGYELSVFDADERLLACSYFHLGEKAVSGTYCFFEPEVGKRSLGTYTMLQELLLARDMGLDYYYHGYCYDVPSQFDYKLNFNNLEVMDWKSGLWEPHQRMPVRQWDKLVNEP